MVRHEHSSGPEEAPSDPPLKRRKIDQVPQVVAMADRVDNLSSTELDSQAHIGTTYKPIVKATPTAVSTERNSYAPQETASKAPASTAPSTMADAPDSQAGALEDQVSKEAAYGITEFVSPDLLGFTGILKKRYTDFLVNEILPSGRVVHLDNLEAPTQKKQELHNGLGPSVSRTEAKETVIKVKYEANVGMAMQDSELSACTGVGTETGPAPLEPSSSAVKLRPSVESDAATTDPHRAPRDISAPSQRKDSSSLTRMPDLELTAEQNLDTPTKKGDPPLTPSVPQSMEGFNPPIQKTENISPHMRIPPRSPSVPVCMRELDYEERLEKPIRKKETVRIRHTSEGWVEVDEQEAKDLEEAMEANDAKGAANAAAGIESEDAAKQEPTNEELVVEEHKAKEPRAPSTQAQWQTFARAVSADAAATTGFKLKSEDLTLLLRYFGEAVVDAILALHDRIVNSPHRKTKEYGTVKSLPIDRQTRSSIHQDLRRIFSSRLESMTDNDGGIIIMALAEKPSFNGRTPMSDNRGSSHRNENTRGRARNDRGNDARGGNHHEIRQPRWAELGGDFLHFSLFKENKDTMEAIAWLVKQLNTKASTFQFAGTKDRRAVTVQRVSVYRIFAERMVAAARSLRGSKIGNYEYQPRPLQLGELSGNEFVITLRDCDFHYPLPVDSKTMVDVAQAVVGEAIKNLGDRGFINYYGLQRFGTFSTSTDQVGVKMLQGDFEAAVNSILQYNPASAAAAHDPMTSADDRVSRDDQARGVAIESFKATGKPIPALHHMPKKFSSETSVIRHLSRTNSSKDYLGAMQTIPRNMRLMYVHAYQSLVWNMAASERWKRFGAAITEGDLVLIDEHKDKIEPAIQTEEVDADGEAIIHPSKDDRAAEPEEMFCRARALTKEEAESGKYTIFDVVLPTPGYDILYPANEIEKFYEEFMRSERGGGLDPHNMRRRWKDVSLSGSYRKFLARPGKDFSFDVKVYKEEHEQFVETDLDKMNTLNDVQHRRFAPVREDPAKTVKKHEDAHGGNDQSKSGSVGEASSSDNEPGGVSLSGGPYRDYKIAVILKLQLGSSQYATIALRELMKHGGMRTHKQDFGGGR